MNFIEVYDNALTSEQCKLIIDYMNSLKLMPGAVGMDRKVKPETKDSLDLPMNLNQETEVDCIIIDSTDPVDNSKVLITKSFLRGCFKALKSGGLIIQQSGSPIKDTNHIINPLMKKYESIGFKKINLHSFPMPLYPTGTWSFLSAKRA